jgi:hypothetical protein
MLYSIGIYPPPGVMCVLEQTDQQNQYCFRALAFLVLEKTLRVQATLPHIILP